MDPAGAKFLRAFEILGVVQPHSDLSQSQYSRPSLLELPRSLEF